MRIELHDIVFNAEPDANGIAWLVDDLEGWSSPTTRLTPLDPTYRHGATPATGLYGARAMTMTGVVKAPSEALFWQAYNRLLGVTNNLLIPRELRVQEDVLKTCYVTRGAEPRLIFVGVGAFAFEVPLTANDPLKYGAEQTVNIAPGGTATITNTGNETSYRITATTQAAGSIALRNGEERVSTGDKELLSGAVVDFYERTLYRGEHNRYNKLTPKTMWWGLLPGGNTVRNNGSAGVTITYRPAWV